MHVVYGCSNFSELGLLCIETLIWVVFVWKCVSEYYAMFDIPDTWFFFYLAMGAWTVVGIVRVLYDPICRLPWASYEKRKGSIGEVWLQCGYSSVNCTIVIANPWHACTRVVVIVCMCVCACALVHNSFVDQNGCTNSHVFQLMKFA